MMISVQLKTDPSIRIILLLESRSMWLRSFSIFLRPLQSDGSDGSCFLDDGGGGGGDGDRILFLAALCSLQVRWVGFDGGILMDQ